MNRGIWDVWVIGFPKIRGGFSHYQDYGLLRLHWGRPIWGHYHVKELVVSGRFSRLSPGTLITVSFIMENRMENENDDGIM